MVKPPAAKPAGSLLRAAAALLQRIRAMGSPPAEAGSTYSPLVAFIYVFNLVVGTGVLALPAVLTTGGWVLGGLFLFLVASLSYVGVTFMIESMAAANALLYYEKKTSQSVHDSESTELLDSAEKDRSPFEIVRRTELGQMAEMFFNRTGRVLFYVALILYLFGDAAIYCTFVPRSMVGFMYGDHAPPWAFNMFLALFIVLIVPFCFFDFQKTKLLQMATMAIRNASLLTIIVLASASALRTGGKVKEVPLFELRELPNLFGGAVYAFMCHHSLPGIITPMQDKELVTRVIGLAFIGIFSLYILLFVSCGIAFVFTLSSSFPMLSITLRNNLDTLLHLILPPKESKARLKDDLETVAIIDPRYLDKAALRRIGVTLLAVGPPIACCLAAEHFGLNVNSLVGITGAYAGAAVMFIIPACLVHCSRMTVAQDFRGREPIHESGSAHPPLYLAHNPHPSNIHASPFRGRTWVCLLVIMAVLAMLFNTYEKGITG
eukprot:SM000350S13032  [mRNA]  locus=s350:85248:90472:+ [translate_table: standard]